MKERTSEAYPASATVTAANTATAQGDVWTGTVTVGEIRDFNGFGYVAAPHPLAFTGGSLSDDDFDIDGTTYTVWRITIGTPVLVRLGPASLWRRAPRRQLRTCRTRMNSSFG